MSWCTSRKVSPVQASCGRYLQALRAPSREVCRKGLPKRAGFAPQATAGIDVRESPVTIPVYQNIIREFHALREVKDRYKLLLDYANELEEFPESQKTNANRVMGCTAQVWVTAQIDTAGRVQFQGTSDAELTKGLLSILVRSLSGLTPQEIVQITTDNLEVVPLGPTLLGPSRINGWMNMLESMRRKAQLLAKDVPRFPSLVITADELKPQGAFAEAQAQYLAPDPKQVDSLVSICEAKRLGVVAHFYMDPEVQGVLSSAAERWPHIAISDSLVMADTAVKMAKAGCTSIAVLGVDFMSENVRAILDEAGYKDVKVYRMSASKIGCSLAEAAETPAYTQYLTQAAHQGRSLHVIYINTSLRTKAQAQQRVPTITCTSSNVVQVVLQAFSQVPGLTVWYGPDTYMGHNLTELFTALSSLSDEEVRELHPAHTAASLSALLPRLKAFEDGTCIVHHIFGTEVCEILKLRYNDAYLTAHFEVPGEMFRMAIAAKRRGMGVVGSTSNILDFIASKVSAALTRPHPDRLEFVLGTEAGMITSIVRKVQAMLKAAGRPDVEVEIVFPVMPKAITTPQQQVAGAAPVTLPTGLAILPGPAAGEGCSLEGGCAACPYMKMNTLQALQMVGERLNTPQEVQLEAFKPQAYAEHTVSGESVAQLGCVPILHMRDFQKASLLSEALVQDIMSRQPTAVNGHQS